MAEVRLNQIIQNEPFYHEHQSLLEEAVIKEAIYFKNRSIQPVYKQVALVLDLKETLPLGVLDRLIEFFRAYFNCDVIIKIKAESCNLDAMEVRLYGKR